jgi:arylsulfatase A-like enzyme
MTKPNVVILMADQLRADAVGRFGGFASTPNIDALAARGVTFTNAYSQSSVCAPSRISIQTSWYPHVRGHRSIAHLLQPDEPSLFKAFRDAGYHVAAPGLRGDTFSPAARAAALDRWGYESKPETYFHFSPSDTDGAHARAFFHGPRNSSGPTLDMDEATIRTAEKWIAEGLPEPFVLFVGLFFPHPPFEVEEPWFSLHDRSRMPTPVVAELSSKPAFMRALAARQRLDRYSEKDWRELRAVYAGMVSRADDQLGRILDALDRNGASDDAVVCFLSDHGDYLGDYGLVEKWPSGLDECLLRNPLILATNDCAAGRESSALVEMIDLTPTLTDLCGLTLRHQHFGKSLSELLRDPSKAHRSAVFSEGGFALSEAHLRESADFPYDIKSALQGDQPECVGRAIAIRTDEWTYIRRLHDRSELYSRTTDRGERRNLAGDGEHRAIESDLENRILEWLIETSDVSPLIADPRF